ncbi:MAG: hemolysin III family protein [Natronohydrobacter sp.]|nr:hemolysin III family protein [Natronohydrobacter sp.]
MTRADFNDSASTKTYSAAERRLDAAIHYLGLASVMLAVPLLIGAAVMRALSDGSGQLVLAASIYGATFVAMIGASALFNLGLRPALDWLFQRLDHAAIYLKIAGTYTPFTLITGQGLWLLAGLWGAAACGVVLKLISPARFKVLAIALYLGMGWVGLVILPDLAQSLSPVIVGLMLAGGLVYTVGVVFYLWQALPYHFAIWHVFVLVASFLFYAAIMVLVLGG